MRLCVQLDSSYSYALSFRLQALAAEWKALDEAERLPFVELAAERTAAAPLRLPKAPKASKAVKRAAPSSPDIDIEPETQDADIDVTPVTKKPTPPGATTGVVEWCAPFPAFLAARCAQ